MVMFSTVVVVMVSQVYVQTHQDVYNFLYTSNTPIKLKKRKTNISLYGYGKNI